MSILTILLALLLGSTGSANMHLTSVIGGGPVGSPSPDGVYGGGPVGSPSPDNVIGGGPVG